ncbi:hypothetical protein K493DRAFT_315276 [Basidiobolus meristosporus CBS 931.73]|uniref:C2 domain-containing protein n=1 Tax=Basidiobolus meristosporus CBS 931.73 TaxID=1314790 RepID=A0A1Y1YA45_9FUNG|nr:hypothetical protein K493DRAFT_315276 [Basidiobolus meristosporus CBS 931.73]|eukprot:ORX94899.1 hypothetical protein K493DRAFT_315276 [Basidiobolus meristosporus CBS 931.73]
MPRGTLHIFAIEGKNLKNVEFMGKSDPYLVLHLDSANKQQTDSKKDTLNPAWQQRFTFDVYEGNNELQVECLDKERTGKDELIGSISIPLNEVFSSGSEVDKWYPIQDKKGKDAGELHIALKFVQ